MFSLVQLQKTIFLLPVICFVILSSGCGGGGGNGDSSSTNPQPSQEPSDLAQFSGYVLDDPVKGAKVRAVFADGTLSEANAVTDANGYFVLTCSAADTVKICGDNVTPIEGADEIFLQAEFNNHTLRGAVASQHDAGKNVYITNDSEALAWFLDSFEKLSPSSLKELQNELQAGRIKDSSAYAEIVKVLREEVKEYFYNGASRLSNDEIFSLCLANMDKSELALTADDPNLVPNRQIMSGGDIVLPAGTTASCDEVILAPQGNGERYKVGDGNDQEKEIYIKVKLNERNILLPLTVKPRVVQQLAQALVEPGAETTLGSTSVQANIPPFALNEACTISLNKIISQGETSYGKVLLDMQPHGVSFEVPITMNIHYADFGITDPYSVSWNYGSPEQGYDDAEIISVDTSAQIISLAVQHFSSIVVKKLRSKKYINLGYRFVTVIPARNKAAELNGNGNSGVCPANRGASLLISNKLFRGDSFNHRFSNGVGAGHCVQTVKILQSLKFGKYASKGDAQEKIDKVYDIIQSNNTSINDKLNDLSGGKVTVRLKKEDIAEGDTICIWKKNNYGHTTYAYTYDGTFGYIESNNYLPEYKRDDGSSAGSLRIDPFVEPTGDYAITYDAQNNTLAIAREKNNYIAFSINAAEKQDTSLGTSFCEVKSWEKPWRYYLLDTKDDGITQNGSDFIYDPELLPVAPVKIDNSTEPESIADMRDSRMEIYVETSALSNDKITFHDSLENYGYTLQPSRQDTLEFDGKNMTQMFMEYNGGNHTELKYFLSGDVNRTLKVKGAVSPVAVLFSPTVIDDTYVSWEGGVPDIPIGFWSDYGWNVTDGGEYTNATTLEGGMVYSSGEALNRYFMTLGKDKNCRWYFSQAGKHAILVHIPTGNYERDLEGRTYKLRLNGADTSPHILKVSPFKEKYKSGFENWYALYEDTDEGPKYVFDLTGNDILGLSNTKDTPAVVDGIRLQSKFSIGRDAGLASGSIEVLLDQEDILPKIKAKLFEITGVGGLRDYRESQTINVTDNVFSFSRLNTGKYKVLLFPSYQEHTMEENRIQPQTLYFEVSASQPNAQLPKVILTKKGTLASLNVKVVDATDGRILPETDVQMTFGIDKEDGLVAFPGTTNAEGIFKASNVPYGDYTIELSKQGYTKANFVIRVNSQTPEVTDLTLSPLLASEEMRIILTWGEEPRDLDSHLQKDKWNQNIYHIFYSQPRFEDDNLDLDDRDGFGPETITIKPVDAEARYTYYVHKYAGEGSIGNSTASVKIIYGDKTMTLYPASHCEDYWTVFYLDDGQIIPYNADTTENTSRALNLSFKKLPVLP